MAQPKVRHAMKSQIKSGTRGSAKHGKESSISRPVDAQRNNADGSLLPEPSKPPQQLTQGLYIVATPIGNASDITLRALQVLKSADVIACEDTRVTRKLMQIHGLESSRLVSYHEHNADKIGPRLIEQMNSGKIVALVSDAGTPMINDPGYRLAANCREAGIAVQAIPGPSAVTNALVLAGLPTDRFMYCGFPPPKQGKRRTWLGGVIGVDATLVFLESPQRLADSLADMADVFGPRPACVTREMTKMFEEVRHGTLAELAAHYAEAGAPKGEVTLVVGGPLNNGAPDDDDIDARLKQALTTDSVREAAQRIAMETGLPRRDIYNRALAIKANTDA